MTELNEADLRALASKAGDRMELWTSFLRAHGVRTAAEIGVYRGAYAEWMLSDCPELERYYLLDPWRHLDDWNKPANKADDIFERYFKETMQRTEAQAGKRVVLRGTTTEVVDQIPDGSLDFVYIDGDHTLRGITTDLARCYPKVRDGAFLAGDDFCRNVFQQPRLRADPGLSLCRLLRRGNGSPPVRPSAQAVPVAEGAHRGARVRRPRRWLPDDHPAPADQAS